MVRRIPRRLARAPVPLFEHGFGWLLGPRLVMLEHRGRKTGKPRRVSLEIVEREPGALYIVSGYGTRSQWFRNVSAEPSVRVWFGNLRGAAARVVVLSEAETRRRLTDYRQRNPRGARMLGRVLQIPELAERHALPSDLGRRLPMLRVVPAGERPA